MSGGYSNEAILLTNAGERIIGQEGDFLLFQNALSGGAVDLDAVIEVRPESDQDDSYIRMVINNSIEGHAKRWQVKWDAQAGVTAYIFISNQAEMRVSAPPSKQLVTSSIGTILTDAVISVTNSATLIKAATSGRQSISIQNLGAADMFIGNASVTTSTGLKVANGETYVIDKTTAAIYGITASGTADVRYLEET